MPYSVEYDPQTDIIKIKVDGLLTLAMAREYSNTAMLIAKERECFRILTDLREASIQLSMLEVYSFPRMVVEITSALGLPVQKFRRATLLPDQFRLSVFFENIMKNRLQNVNLFHDVETAQKWLLEK